MIYNRETDQSRGFGFVTMSTVEEAEKAVDRFNRYVSVSVLDFVCRLSIFCLFMVGDSCNLYHFYFFSH